MAQVNEIVERFYAAPYPEADREIAARLPAQPFDAAVAVTLLSYNRRACLVRTLESFLACCKFPREWLHVIALDQGSTDGSLEWLEKQKHLGNVQELIALGANIGPAEGRNRLLDAVPNEIGYVFHLEDDWEFDVAGDWISPGLELLRIHREIGMIRYRHKPSDHVIAGRGDIECVTLAPFGNVLVSQLGIGFTNTPNLARMMDYRAAGRFADPQHEYRYGQGWPYRWAQFIRVCRHIGETSAFTRLDVDRFDGGKKMCSGAVKE